MHILNETSLASIAYEAIREAYCEHCNGLIPESESIIAEGGESLCEPCADSSCKIIYNDSVGETWFYYNPDL